MRAALAFKRLMRDAARGGEPRWSHHAAVWCGCPVYLIHDAQQAAAYEVDVEAYARSGLSIPLPHEAFLIEARLPLGSVVLGIARANAMIIDGTLKPLPDTSMMVIYGQMSRDNRLSVMEAASCFVDVAHKIVEPLDEKTSGAVARVATLATSILAMIARRGTIVTDVHRSRLRQQLDARAAGAKGWEYRLVTIPEGLRPVTRIDRGGTHASPIWHVRRGHLRRLKSGKAVEVRECEVGDPSRGGIVKDYEVP